MMYIRSSIIAALIGTLALAMNGCMEYQVTYDGMADLRRQFNLPPADPNGGARERDPLNPSTDTQVEGWSILLEEFDGPSRFDRANSLARRLSANGFTDIWMREVSGKVGVYRGRYAQPTDLDAQHALLHTRQFEQDGVSPYGQVDLTPLGDSTQAAAPRDPLDLKYYAGYYTLQIGYYDQDYGDDFRDAAAGAVRQLRTEGHRAFYYHGPNRSMICVGLFTDDDFDQDGPIRVYGPAMLDLQRQFPHNLGNGRTVVQVFREGEVVQRREQQSSIVRVP